MQDTELLQGLLQAEKTRDVYSSRWYVREWVVNQSTGRTRLGIWCDSEDFNKGPNVFERYYEPRRISDEDLDRIRSEAEYIVALHNAALARIVLT